MLHIWVRGGWGLHGHEQRKLQATVPTLSTCLGMCGVHSHPQDMSTMVIASPGACDHDSD